jgi:hypothetical protein
MQKIVGHTIKANVSERPVIIQVDEL